VAGGEKPGLQKNRERKRSTKAKERRGCGRTTQVPFVRTSTGKRKEPPSGRGLNVSSMIKKRRGARQKRGKVQEGRIGNDRDLKDRGTQEGSKGSQ